ncbi:MAG: hypothetical protein LBQ69_01040 [Treponema sp.]|jgi:hypothetical protein|nr:hypothetical protein [Treponema sp.]
MKAVTACCIVALVLAGTAPLHGSDWAFTGYVPGRHRGEVNAIIHRGDIVLSAGEDGFLEIWNTRSRAAEERFQLSPHSIIAMAGRPGSDEVCVVETDGFGLYRVSAWNYRQHRNIFTLRFTDPVSYVAYSMGGNFIIAARNGRSRLAFIDAATGELLQSPPSLAGNITLAATGRSERNMVVYLSTGALSYWDLETGNETNHFEAPPNLFSPVLFSNSRFLAGVNTEGLALVHAASGELLGRDAAIPDGSLLCASDNALICLVQRTESAAELHRYTVDLSGHLVTTGQVSFSVSGLGADDHFTAMAASSAANSAVALGTASGSLVTVGTNGRAQLLGAADRTQITDAAVAGSTIAFAAEGGTMGFIPLDYRQLTARRTIQVEKNAAGHNRVTAYARENGGGDQFIFWQDRNTQGRPALRSSRPGAEAYELVDISLKSPIRSAASFGGKILLLDSTGNISVISPFDGESRPFTFFSMGLMDAALVDRDRLIIGRSALSGNTPFMVINVNTGETVPLPYPSQAGITVYRGSSGSIYAAAISSQAPDGEADGSITSILQLSLENAASSVTLVDFHEEDTQLSLAETPEGIAATIGGEGAAIYSTGGIEQIDRTNGLPLRLIDGGQYLIKVDMDGNIAWHDNRGGSLLAVFRLHQNGWTLQTDRRTVGGGFAR